MKIAYKLKKIKRKIKLYIELPHIWTLLLIVILSVIMCLFSVYYKDTNSFASSICANIFAGLITGVIICLITTIKSISLYRTEHIIEWLNDLHGECLEFIKMHRKIVFAKENNFTNDEFYDLIYDTLCFGNSISQTISQGQFKESLPFNTYKYCKKEFNFDAVEVMKSNENLRNEITCLDISLTSKSDLMKLFEKMTHQVQILNGDILSKIQELNIKKKAINVSIG